MVTTRFAWILCLLAILLTVPCARADDETPGVVFLEDPASLEAVLERARSEGKDVVIDFTADWCGWCHKLDEDVFSKAEAVKPFDAFVCARFDVDKTVGSKIAARFHVNGYPTVLFLEWQGNEIDRISGYSPLEPYLKDVARIARNENTLRSLGAYVADHPDDLEVGALYVTKLAEANPPRAAEMLPGMIARSGDADPLARAQLLLLLATSHRDTGRHDEAFDVWERIVTEVAGTEEALKAAWNAGWVGQRFDPRRGLAIVEKALASEPDEDGRARLHEVRVQLLLEQLARALDDRARAAWDDGMQLNEVAWEAYLRRTRLEQAVGWAERAAKLTARAPAVLDTLANLLFEAGRLDEAIEVETEALRTAEEPSLRLQFQEVVLRMRAVRLHRTAAKPK